MTDALVDATGSDPGQRELLPVIVIGAGGHAGVLLNTLHLMGRRVLFVTDSDREAIGKSVQGVEIRGDDDLIFEHAPDSVELVNGVGSAHVTHRRQELFERFRGAGYRFASVIHPSAVVASTAELGHGVQIMAGAVIQHNAVLAENVLVNTRASVGHDCSVGSHVHVSAGVTLCGGVVIDTTSHIGAGATVVQGIRIGKATLVAAGALVARSVADGQIVKGVPARPAEASGTGVSACTGSVTGAPTYRVMLSASGRRVSLMHCLKDAGAGLNVAVQVLATDIHRLNATHHLADHAEQVPGYSEPHCLQALLELVDRYEVKLIVPTIDPELMFYAEHQQAFAQRGVAIMVSSVETIEICNDKQRTYEWLCANGLPTVAQVCSTEWPAVDGDWSFPLFAKPRMGSSSIGARQVDSERDLAGLIEQGGYVIQELARGQEYTVDVYVDASGRCRCMVPRLRLETRGGEVTKGMTVRHAGIAQTARRVVEALPGARGVLNVQMFHDPQTDQLRVLEINPRLGGGYPLTHEAGAPMMRWLLEEAMGLPLSARDDQWRDGVVMLRYDEAIFVDRQEAGL